MLRPRYVVVRLCLSKLFADMLCRRSKIELGRASMNEDGARGVTIIPTTIATTTHTSLPDEVDEEGMNESASDEIDGMLG